MTNLEGTKEQKAYLEAKKKYLEVGKRYASLLRETMSLDPEVLRIASDILTSGDRLSAHDNQFLTSFYTQLRSKSKINNKYYELLLELKKTRSELANATHELSKKRVPYLLRKAGIPPKRTNLDVAAIVGQVNDTNLGLLEKISLPEVLDVESGESLDELICEGQLHLENGKLVPKTRIARDFLRGLEGSIRRRINNSYFMNDGDSLIRPGVELSADDVLGLMRLAADTDHVREIERRIDVGDVQIVSGKLVAKNDKGKKYLGLLSEELVSSLHKKLQNEMLERNQKHAATDPRLNRVSLAINDLDISLSKHLRLLKFAGSKDPYAGLVSGLGARKSDFESRLADIMLLQESISVSFADIKKQLLLLLSMESVNIESLLSVLIATRYLSFFEKKYEKKLVDLERSLGVYENHTECAGPLSIARIAENYEMSPDIDAGLGRLVDTLLKTRLDSKKYLGPNANSVLSRSLLGSTIADEYKRVLHHQATAKRHISDSLIAGDCLYRGASDVSELILEFAELDLERTEKLNELVHEIELLHKEMWLAQIKNNNQGYLEANFAGVAESARKRAIATNNESVESARTEIRGILDSYKNEHDEHAGEFKKLLRSVSSKLGHGGDVTALLKELKLGYSSMQKKHVESVQKLENDLAIYEKRLNKFEQDSPGGLEKILISDIRANI